MDSNKGAVPQEQIIPEDDLAKLVRTLELLAPVLAEQEDKLGIAIFIFDFGDGRRMQWGSNAQRVDMVAALREFLGVLSTDPLSNPN